MKNQTQITAPVTPELLAVLIDTEKFIAQYNDSGARLKDTEHYGAAAVQLEALVTAIMVAQTRVALLGRSTIGARFHVGAGMGLMRSVDNATVYLSTIASDLLRKSNLSRYEKNHTTEVLNLMSELMGRFTDDIQSVVRTDLGRIRGKSVELLMATADVVAKIEGGYAKASAESNLSTIRAAINATESPREDLRCDYPTGHGRCVWPAGHRSGSGAMYCVGENDPSRCRVDMGGGIRCMKPAGHFARNPKDEHAPAIDATFTEDNRCWSLTPTGRCILPEGHSPGSDDEEHIGPTN